MRCGTRQSRKHRRQLPEGQIEPLPRKSERFVALPYRLAQRGEILAFKLGGTWRFRRNKETTLDVCARAPRTSPTIGNPQGQSGNGQGQREVRDGVNFEAEDLTSGETIACAYKDFPDHFGFFLPLAGISTVRQISESACDIRATSDSIAYTSNC